MEAEGPSTPAAFAESHVTLPKEEFLTKFPRLEELPSFLEHQSAALSALGRGAPNQDIEETTNINVAPNSQGNGYHKQKLNTLILGLRPVNERRCYFVTTSPVGWAQA